MPGFDLTKLFVNMINGKTGVVKLDAEDVHALPDDTVIPEPSDALPQDLGEATPGISDEYARADHVHNMSGSSSEIASITFPAVWTDSGNGYYTATPTISGVTLSAESKIDLQITAAQFLTLQGDGVENLYVENNNAALTAYSVGGYPSAEITLQCTITGTQAPTPPRNPSLDMIYPIGSIYMNVANVNPGNLIGGTWERVIDSATYLQKDLLWTNPNPTASFAAQDVTLSTGYDFIVIFFVSDTASGHSSRIKSVMFPTGVANPGFYVDFANGSDKYIGSRVGTFTASTGVLNVAQGYYNGSSNNAWCIPQCIYGIKETSPFDGVYRWKRTA